MVSVPNSCYLAMQCARPGNPFVSHDSLYHKTFISQSLPTQPSTTTSEPLYSLASRANHPSAQCCDSNRSECVGQFTVARNNLPEDLLRAPPSTPHLGKRHASRGHEVAI